MCKKTYFNHDSNARNDEKIVALRIRYGAEGYGVYFMLIEMLQAAPGCTLEKDYKALAFDLRVSARRIKSIVEDFDLFTPTDGGNSFYSERLIKYASDVDESYERYAEAGRKGMKARWKKSEPITMLSEKHNDVIDFDNDVIQATPDAEIKEENEREKETFPPITPYKEKEKAKEDSPKGESSDEDSPKSAPPAPPYGEVVDMWNSVCRTLPRVVKLTDVRRMKIRQRLSEWGGTPTEQLATLRALLERVEASPFLHGASGRGGWTASFDWLFANESNWVKVSEGNYDARPELLTNANTEPNGTYQTRMDRERAENAERKRQLAEMAANACAKADALNAARFGNP